MTEDGAGCHPSKRAQSALLRNERNCAHSEDDGGTCGEHPGVRRGADEMVIRAWTTTNNCCYDIGKIHGDLMSWLPSNDPVLGDPKSCDRLDLVIVPRPRDL